MDTTRRLFLGALILLLAVGTARAQKKSARKEKLKLPKGIHWHPTFRGSLVRLRPDLHSDRHAP